MPSNMPRGYPGVRRNAQVFFTNNFPGNCFTSRFISKLNNATDTAELGRPALRMTSSIAIVYSENRSFFLPM